MVTFHSNQPPKMTRMRWVVFIQSNAYKSDSFCEGCPIDFYISPAISNQCSIPHWGGPFNAFAIEVQQPEKETRGNMAALLKHGDNSHSLNSNHLFWKWNNERMGMYYTLRRCTFDRMRGKWIVNNVAFISILKTEIKIKKIMVVPPTFFVLRFSCVWFLLLEEFFFLFIIRFSLSSLCVLYRIHTHTLANWNKSFSLFFK